MGLKNIIFTGGGSGGHVMPSLTLIKVLRQSSQLSISYIGGSGIEKSLVPAQGIKFQEISTGKLRRYFSLQNFFDLFKVFVGFFQSLEKLIGYTRSETLVFSTGGFVSVPVVLAAKLLGFRVYLHEQTSRVGLANKICSKFADRVFVSFDSSKKYFPAGKTIYSGYPVRDSCYTESIDLGEEFISEKPLLFATGGGNGAQIINSFIKNNLDDLTKNFFVVHQVGQKYISEYAKLARENYLPLEFIGDEIISLFKKSKIIISRAGAGTVCELLAIGKKSVYIPLGIAQKNEQFHNAKEAEKKIGSIIINEERFASMRVEELLALLESSPTVERGSTDVIPLDFLIEQILQN